MSIAIFSYNFFHLSFKFFLGNFNSKRLIFLFLLVDMNIFGH